MMPLILSNDHVILVAKEAFSPYCVFPLTRPLIGPYIAVKIIETGTTFKQKYEFFLKEVFQQVLRTKNLLWGSILQCIMLSKSYCLIQD